MHKNEIKFLVTSRFISSEKIDVVTALSFEDSPVILHTEFHREINQTVASLRKLNGILNNVEASIPGRAHAHIHGTFWKAHMISIHDKFRLGVGVGADHF